MCLKNCPTTQIFICTGPYLRNNYFSVFFLILIFRQFFRFIVDFFVNFSQISNLSQEEVIFFRIPFKKPGASVFVFENSVMSFLIIFVIYVRVRQIFFIVHQISLEFLDKISSFLDYSGFFEYILEIILRNFRFLAVLDEGARVGTMYRYI